MSYTKKKKKDEYVDDSSNSSFTHDQFVELYNSGQIESEEAGLLDGDDFTHDKFIELYKNGQVAYNTDPVENYFSEAKGLLDKLPKDGSTPTYNWASESYDVINRLDDIIGEERYIESYLETLKGTDKYEAASKQFNDYRSALAQTKSYLNELNKFASQYDNEDDYNKAITEMNRRQKYQGASYDELIKLSKYIEAEDEDEANWLRGYANETISYDEAKAKQDELNNRLTEINAEMEKRKNRPLPIESNPTDNSERNPADPFGVMNDPLINLPQEAAEIKKKLEDEINPLVEMKRAQKNNAEYTEKYKGLSYGELKTKISDENSEDENKWLEDKADETATSDDYEKEIAELEAIRDKLVGEQQKKNPPTNSLGNNSTPANREESREYAQELSEYDSQITKLKEKLIFKQREEQAANYENTVRENDDFEENSKFAGEKEPDPFLRSFSEGNVDDVYEAINNRSVNWAPDTWANDQGVIDRLSNMTDDEKATFNYLYNTGKKDEALEYKNSLERKLNERYTEAKNVEEGEYAKEHPVLGSLKSVGTNLFSGEGVFEDIGKRIINEPIDINSPAHDMANQTRAIRQSVGESFDDEAGKYAYDTVMSAVDSAVVMGLATATGGAAGAAFGGSEAAAATIANKVTSTASSLIMGSQVATNTVIDAKERGLTDDQAVTLGVLYGSVEALSEKYSIEHWLGNPKSIGSYLGKAFVAEGSEEVVANWGDRLADLLVTGDKNQINQMYKNYLDQGYSDKEAFTLTAYNLIGEDTKSFIAGGVSGAAMGGAHMAASGAINKIGEVRTKNAVASELIKSENKETLNSTIDFVKNTAESGSKEFKFSEKLGQAVENGDTISVKDAKKLLEYSDNLDQKKYDTATKGFTNEEKAIVNNAVHKLTHRQSLSDQENAQIKGNDKIIKAISDYSGIEQDEVVELLDSSKFKDNLKYYKSNGNGLLEIDGKEFRGTVEIEGTDPATGKATLKLTSPDGKDVRLISSDNANFKNDTEARLYATAANFKNPNEANAFVENYDGGDFNEYLNEWNLYSNYGSLGFNAKQIYQRINQNVDTPSRKAAYYSGMENFKAFAQIQNINKRAYEAAAQSFKGYQRGTFVSNVSSERLNKMSRAQRNSIRELKMFTFAGLNVELFELKADKHGNYQGENGSFNAKTKTLRVDINAGYSNNEQAVKEAAKSYIRLTVGHELTHAAEQGGGYMKLRAEIIRTLEAAGFDYKGLVDKKLNELNSQDKYKGIGKDELYRLADSEVIADCCETLLNDSKVFEKLFNADKTLAEKFINAVKRAIEKLRQFFKENPTYARTEYGKALQEAMSKVENRVQELWDEAVAQGIRAENKESGSKSEQFSIKKTQHMSYNKQLNLIEQGKLNGSNSLFVGYINPRLMAATNISANPFVMNQKDYRKSRRDSAKNKNYSKHGVPKDFFESLPKRINDIALAFDNGGKITLITDYPMLDRNGQDSFVILGVWKDQKMENDIVNQIKSAYPLDDINKIIVKNFDSGNLIVVDEKRAKKILDTIGIQPSEVSNILDSNDTVSQTDDNVKHSDRFDTDYLSAVKRGDMKTAQQMVDEAAERAFMNSKIRDDYGKLIKVYHGTEDNFTVFDKTKGRANMDIQGMFFSPWELDAQGYGSNVKAFYLNITNPADESTGYRALNGHKGENNAGIKAREDLVRMGYDGVNNSDEEYIAFNSSQIKSADPVTYDDDGNVIPLSERFNEEKEDIRYSDRYSNDDIRNSVQNHFGHTYSWNETGYITTDGQRIDFSGRHEGAPGGRRSVDHRDILDGYPEELQDKLDGSEAMYDFISRGNIRIHPEMGGINLAIEPTSEQKRRLRDYISRERGEVTLDITDKNGNTLLSTEYPKGTSSSKIFSDISEFFANGTKPTVSDLGQFRYQDRYNEFDDLFDMGEDLFEDSSKREIFDEMIEKYPDDALYIIKHAAEQTVENFLTKTKSVQLDNGAYLYVARKFMQEYNISRAANPEEDSYLAAQIGNIVARTEAGELSQSEIMNEFINTASDALVLSGTLDDTMKNEREFVISLIKGKTLLVTDQQEDHIRENYGDLRRYRTTLGHGYVALEKNAKKKSITGAQGVYIEDIIEEVQEAYPQLIDEDANQITGFGWLEKLLNERLEPTFKSDSYSTPEIDAVNGGYEIMTNLVDQKARQIVRDNKNGQKYAQLGNTARELAQEQRKAVKEAVSKVKEKERQKAKKDIKEAREKAEARYKAKLEKKEQQFKEKLDEQREKTRELRREKNDVIIAEKQKRVNDLRRLRDNRERREVIEKINKTAAKMRQMILRPTDTAYVPDEFKNGFIEVTDGITQALKLSDDTKIGQHLNKLSDLLRKLATDDRTESVFGYEFDENFRDRVQEFAAVINGKKIDKSLTLREANDIHNLLKSVVTIVRNANKLINSQERRSISEAGIQIMAEQENLDSKWLNKQLKTIKKYFMTPLRMSEIINAYNDKAVLTKLVNELNRGVRKKNMFFMVANKMFDDYREENVKELDHSSKDVREIRWTDNAGNSRVTRMTGMQAMQICMTWNREIADDNLVHISEGGLTIFDPEQLAKGNNKKALEKATKIHGVNNSFITSVASSLTRFEKGYIDIAEQFFNEYSKDAINETSLALKHYKIANSKYYIPIKVDQNSIAKEIEGIKFDSSVENQGMFKTVAPKSRKSIYIQGLDSLINNHIQGVSNYYGLAIPIRNLNKTLNVRNAEYDADGVVVNENTVKDALNKNWGEMAINNYEQMLTDLQNSRASKGEQNSKEINKFIRGFRSNFVTSVLNFNPSVTLKQAASYFTAGAYIDGSILGKGFGHFLAKYGRPGRYKALLDEIDSHTAQHYIRRQGLSSNEIADINDNWLSKAAQNTKIGRKITTSKIAQGIPSGFNPNKWIQNMDCLTTAMLWVATKDQVNRDFNKAKKEIGTDEYWQAVTDLYDKVIEDTQPMYDPLHRPEVLKSSNELVKSIFMFKTQPLQNAGIIYDALGRAVQGNKGAIRKLGKAVASQTASLVTFALMTLAVSMLRHNPRRYRDENDELTAESIFDQVLEDIFTNGMGILFPFGGTEIMTMFTQDGDAVQDNVAVQLNEFIGACRDLYDTIDKHKEAISMGLETDPQDILTALGDFAVVVSQDITGLPVNNAIKNIEGITGWIDDLTDGNGVLESTSEPKKKQVAGRYERQIENGNSAEAEKILNEFYQKELEKAKADKDIKDPESKAQANTRDMLANTYKTEYQEAFLKNDQKTMQKIVKILYSANKYMKWGKGKNQTPLDKKLEEWRKSAKEDMQDKYDKKYKK